MQLKQYYDRLASLGQSASPISHHRVEAEIGMEASTMARCLLSPLPPHQSKATKLPLSRPPHRLQPSSIALECGKRMSCAVRCSADGALKVEAEVPIERKLLAFPTVMDIDRVREILPHRFPFLLVDRVIEYQQGVTAVAIKNVTINDNFFPGHFPERPIMPGVLMVEAMAQVGGIVLFEPEEIGSRGNFFFAGIDKVRFRKPVTPGDTLVMRMTLLKLNRAFGVAKLEGKAYVGGEVVCEGEFLLATGTRTK